MDPDAGVRFRAQARLPIGCINALPQSCCTHLMSPERRTLHARNCARPSMEQQNCSCRSLVPFTIGPMTGNYAQNGPCGNGTSGRPRCRWQPQWQRRTAAKAGICPSCRQRPPSLLRNVSALGNHNLDRCSFWALVSVDVHCGGSVVVTAPISNCGIAVCHGCDKTQIHLFPVHTIWRPVHVISGYVCRGRSIPMEIDNVVRCGLDDNVVRSSRSTMPAACDLHFERVRSRRDRCASEVE